MQRRLVVGVEAGHPPFGILAAALAHDLGELADVPGQLGQVRTDCIESRPARCSEAIWRSNVIRLTVAASCVVDRAPPRSPRTSAHNMRCKISFDGRAGPRAAAPAR
ncbi:hypothetical protein ACIHDR_15995 [Nocardia sp. NPDC052278]|uniref:hypothetical protein n=1 Tax=unclassified Nocardia TaxID=2637762 RepID=UPI00367A96F3